jgi:serpin B
MTFVALTMLALTLTRCTHQQNPVAPEARELTALEKQLVESDNKFGLKLFREVNKAEAGKNLFISPLSVSMALGMTLNGANGETQSAMEQTLELAGLTTDDINQSYRGLIDLLTQLDPKVTFEIGNSIWYREEMTFEQPFIDANRQYFDAVVRAMNFDNPVEAASIINSWVNDRTHGKIEKIIEPEDIDWSTVMFLINAIYFKGTWTYEFKKDLTKDELFNLADGSTKVCKMMHLTGGLAYFDNQLFQAVDLPYGDSLYSMTVFLPQPGVDVETFIDEINQNGWSEWTRSFRAENVELALPKFKLEYKLNMNDVLIALGMGVAFSGHADFTRMHAPGGLFINEVRHKTFVDVNEEGTEAAAVTSVEIGRTSAPQNTVMRVDRPFVFVIRERHSQTILFMGKVVDPSIGG